MSTSIGAFIESAPPGELHDVINDLEVLTGNKHSLQDSQRAAFRSYNEEQFTTIKLHNKNKQVVVSQYNSLGDNQYVDTSSATSFTFDHFSQKCLESNSYDTISTNNSFISSASKAFSAYADEHFPSSSTDVCACDDDSKIALVLVASKYSPTNFWNGRWRSRYVVDPSSGSVLGSIKVDVHYYEDGNVRLLTTKTVSLSTRCADATDVVRQIAMTEMKYQEDLNRAFMTLSEGAFKSLRRQLPVTRQKVEWDKISGYRLGQDMVGGRSK